ncbi:hypothetical protein E0L21_23860 [Kosakonia quasisacchari]|uniref:Uncharacterized protein n=1 Tax=Kosakonia quasisacchari TaxID=2529380 RepID=A0A4R0GJZ8_9ENTR|nr:hypothetical protein [Kosakonia quasisacchari]TCB96663.1 hypothetical protein E0L21_23860 [Kosakonia quasisacchari]
MHVVTSYENMEMLSREVLKICEKLSIRLSLNSDFNKMITICSMATEINKNKDSEVMLKLCHAKRVLSAVYDCKDEADLREPLQRIAGSVLDPSSPEPSRGKDALFELEFFQYLKAHGYKVRLGEPDIILDAPFGEWYIACKTINSSANFEKQLSSGCAQVTARGNGCVAFNLEPGKEIQNLLVLNDPNEAVEIVSEALRQEIEEFRRHILKKIRDGRLDGIIYVKSRFTQFINTNTDLDVYTTVMYSSDIANQEVDAVRRFNYLSHFQDNVINRGW